MIRKILILTIALCLFLGTVLAVSGTVHIYTEFYIEPTIETRVSRLEKAVSDIKLDTLVIPGGFERAMVNTHE